MGHISKNLNIKQLRLANLNLFDKTGIQDPEPVTFCFTGIRNRYQRNAAAVPVLVLELKSTNVSKPEPF